MVEGGERPGVCAAVHRLEDRGFEFEETAVGQKFPDAGDDFAPVAEVLPDFFVCDEVHVPLAVAFFDIGEAVELFGEGADRF